MSVMIGKQEWLVLQDQFSADYDDQEEEEGESNDKDVAC